MSERAEAGRFSGALPLDETLAIARQIVDALEAAHDKGIIHRDLKPANIMLTAEGQVKVLDFGLAKWEPGGSSGPSGLTHSPTLTFAATQAGVVLGTAAYMSPEQAKGRPSDKRSDVWGFGCVLYEMLAGRRAFDGDDASDVLASVLKSDPDWAAFPANTPAHIQAIVRRCLVKDRKARIPDLSVVRFMLDEGDSTWRPAFLGAEAPGAAKATAGPASSSDARRRKGVWQAAALVLALTTVAAVATIAYLLRPETKQATRFYVYPPEKTTLMTNSRVGASAAISPDGRKLVFSVRDSGGKTLLYVRSFDALTAKPIAGTDNGTLPFWSPDSRFIGYFADRKLMKVDTSGGPPQTLCVCAIGGNRGGAWGRDNVIVFNGGPGVPLMRVSAAGGAATPATRFSEKIGQTFPSFLPDGRHLLLYGNSPVEEAAGVYIASLDTGAITLLTPATSGAVFDRRSGHLLFVREGTLLAQPFNPKTQKLSGEPFPIAERVETVVTPGVVTFSVSDTGVLAYGVGFGGQTGLQITAVDRQGKVIGTVGPPGNYRGLDLSPDGMRLAAHRHDGSGGDIWMIDLSRGTTTRVTFDPTKENGSPVWSADSKRLAFGAVRNEKFGIAQKIVEGGAEDVLLEFDHDRFVHPMSWSPDGKFLVYYTLGNRADLNVVSLEERKSAPFLNAPFTEISGQISPDGKWLAYISDETGRVELYIQSFPMLGTKRQISTSGAVQPRWRGDGRELFFMELTSLGGLMSVDIDLKGAAPVAGTPRRLFDSGFISLGHVAPHNSYAVSPDGQRFYIPRPIPAAGAEAGDAPIVVVHNWFEGAKR